MENINNCGCEICNLQKYINKEWLVLLENEFSALYFKELQKKLHSKEVIFPPVNQIFRFAEYISFNDVKVVILGQDPYHNINQAEGLSFSVPIGITPPPSLKNIFKELSNDIPGFTAPTHGNLTNWAKQGVLLLNDTLTVIKNKPASHSKIGWKIFTAKILNLINNQLNNVVFMLWGNHAREKAKIINKSKHLVLEAGHPSPFSVKRFFNCKHFSKANSYLKLHNKEVIDWNLN